MKKIDTEKVEQAVKMLLEAVGDNPEREGLIETPKRVAKMYQEVFEGMCYTNEEIAQKFDKCFKDTTTGDLVVIGPIDVFSYCEHHIALMYDMQVYVGYIPRGKVIGLSKVARIADMCAKRLQLQERIGADIYDVLKRVLDTDDIIVVIEGSHSCMTARGIKKVDSRTKTSCCNGRFRDNVALRQEFFSLVK
jgi:GTP cyclohydrolase I